MIMGYFHIKVEMVVVIYVGDKVQFGDIFLFHHIFKIPMKNSVIILMEDMTFLEEL